MKLTNEQILELISPPLDSKLTDMLLSEFESLEKRYFLCDWEPATLDGGQFGEISSRILYHIDSGILSNTKSVDNCLKYIEDQNASHNFPERKAALHLSKVIRTIYKFRSDRGAVHIDPSFTANQLDSKLVIECSKWILSEFLRIFGKTDRSKIVDIIKNMTDYDIPIIGHYEQRAIVQRTDCTTEEEILILLYDARSIGLARKELTDSVMRDSSNITKALKKMISSKKREIIKLKNGNFCLTALGINRVIKDLSKKGD